MLMNKYIPCNKQYKNFLCDGNLIPNQYKDAVTGKIMISGTK